MTAVGPFAKATFAFSLLLLKEMGLPIVLLRQHGSTAFHLPKLLTIAIHVCYFGFVFPCNSIPEDL